MVDAALRHLDDRGSVASYSAFRTAPVVRCRRVARPIGVWLSRLVRIEGRAATFGVAASRPRRRAGARRAHGVRVEGSAEPSFGAGARKRRTNRARDHRLGDTRHLSDAPRAIATRGSGCALWMLVPLH